MKNIVITVEVNNYWLEEQQKEGKLPFEQIKEELLKSFTNLKIQVKGKKLEVSKVRQPQNMQVREFIKEYFAENYQMYIKEGDFRLTARIFEDPDEEEEETVQEEGRTSEGEPPVTSIPDSEEREQASQEKAPSQEASETEASSVAAAEQQKAEQPSGKQAETQTSPKKTQAAPNVQPTQETAAEPEDDKYIAIPALEEFLQELGTMARNAKKYKIPETIWSTNVLLSIDDGYGISSINDRIVDLLKKQGFTFNSKTREAAEEFVIPQNPDAADHYWKELLKRVKEFYTEEKQNEKRYSNEPFIIYIDISVYLSDLNNKKLYDYLYQLLKSKGSFIYVFRIPYVEQVAFQNMKNMLTDMFLIRPLVVPPFSCMEMVKYLKRKLRSKGMILQENVDDLLEQLIATEKKDGHFKGFKSVERLSSDIVYNKLSHLQEDQQPVLSREDLKEIYQFIQESEPNPEEILGQLCGMENVKRTIDEIVAQIQLYKEMKQSGKKLSAPTMHMRFVGNPGTGKTTVARLVAQIFREKGILNKGYFYEIKARDLCGRYVGETAPKTSGYCKDALGSVLFIDEAYTLYNGHSNVDYGREAIDTLITEMENNRDNLVVIMAGYKEQMDTLLEANDGLASRMPYEIEFRNYNKKELVDIFYSMLGNDFTYTDGFDSAVREFIESIPDEMLEEDTFSNARMIRNLYERIWSKAAYRRSISGEQEMLLKEEDVQRAISDAEFHQLLVNKKSKIGF